MNKVVKDMNYLSSSGAKKAKKINKIVDNMCFIGPGILLYSLFFTLPLLQGLYYSFTDWNGVSDNINFTGLSNYIYIFTKDNNFFNSMQITIYLAVINVILTNILAMLFAIALTREKKANNFFRAVIFLPNIISMVISGFIWRFMFVQISGHMYKLTGISLFEKNWLGDGRLVLYSIILVSLWQGVGYIMTIYIASINTLDYSIVEAASIDGASSIQCFFKIKLPLMISTVTVGIFLTVSGSLKVFDTVYSLTGGGPGRASEVAMLNIYREAFVFNNPNFGCAKAVLLSLIIIIITLSQLKISSSREIQI
jgi:raffinose/stachyose/melibiose transport system permease protein